MTPQMEVCRRLVSPAAMRRSIGEQRVRRVVLFPSWSTRGEGPPPPEALSRPQPFKKKKFLYSDPPPPKKKRTTLSSDSAFLFHFA